MSNEESFDILLSKLENIENILNQKDRPFLSFKQALEFLDVPEGTLRVWCSKSLLPYYRINNKRVFFKVDDIVQFVLSDTNRFKSRKEIEQSAILHTKNL